MADWPERFIPALPTIHPWSLESIGAGLAAQNNTLQQSASAAWPSANLAIYVPFLVAQRLTITRLWWHNGATVAASNIDVGVYDAQAAGPGNKIISTGSTAQSGANALQSVDVTDTVIGPGLFYFGVALDNGTGTLFRTATPAEALRAFGVFQQATAFALPATATPATMAQAYAPLVGLLQGRTVI